MMRIEPSPQAVLSGNGYLAAVAQAAKVTLVETRTGLTRDLILPHQGALIAFDPQASLFAVSGDRQLSLFQGVENPRLLSTSPIAAWLYRLAVGEGGLVVGVAQFDGENCAGDVAKITDKALYSAKQAGKGRVYAFDQQQIAL